MNVIKETIDLIVQPLTYVTNLSFSSGTVPDQMKIARVVPLFKTGDLSLFTNYRPFSVLPALSKTLFTWSGGPRSSGVSFFCFHALGDTKQKKLTPLDRGPPLHVNRV